MNQILSIIMAIAIAFSSMCGLAASTGDAVSFETKISVDAEALLALTSASGTPVAEDAQQTVKVVGDILDALTLKGVATGDTAELDLLAGTETALSIGVKTGEDGATVASSLLSGDVVFVPAELIEKYKQEMASSVTSEVSAVNAETVSALQNVDKEQIRRDVLEIRDKLAAEIETKKGETETGEFTVDNMTFTGKAAVNMTYSEFAELMMNGMKELAARESVKLLFEVSGKDINAEIDKALEELRNNPEKSYQDFELIAYTDADNCSYYVCSMKKKAAAEGEQDQNVYFAFGEVDSLIRCRMNTEQNGQKMDIIASSTEDSTTEITATIESQDTNADIIAKQDKAGNLDMTANIKAPTMTGKIVVKNEVTADERNNFSLELFMGDDGKAMLTFTGSAGKGGEITSVFEGDELNLIKAEALMDENDQTAASTLQMKLFTGLLKGIMTVSKNVPEDTATWINTQIKQMMSPGTTTESK